VENDSGTAADFAFQFHSLAFRALFQFVVLHALKDIEIMTARLTNILIRRHFQLLYLIYTMSFFHNHHNIRRIKHSLCQKNIIFHNSNIIKQLQRTKHE
jgi:hypothetical protein